MIHHLSDPEQFGIAVSGVHLRADFLAPTRLPTRVEQFQSAGWSLDLHDAQVKARLFGPLPPGWVALGLVRSRVESSWHGRSAAQGVLLCNPPGEPIDGCINPGFTCMSVNVPITLWEQCRALAGCGRSDYGGFAAISLHPTLYASIERSLESTLRHLRAAPERSSISALAACEAAEFSSHMATVAWEISTTPWQPRASLRNRARLVRRTEEWMRDHLDQAVRIPEICLAMGVSRRELEYAFRTCFDQSPRDYLQALRLNAIRQSLRRSATPVTDVALKHGVTHFGRFAAQYRALFGESPSETLRAAR